MLIQSIQDLYAYVGDLYVEETLEGDNLSREAILNYVAGQVVAAGHDKKLFNYYLDILTKETQENGI